MKALKIVRAHSWAFLIALVVFTLGFVFFYASKAHEEQVKRAMEKAIEEERACLLDGLDANLAFIADDLMDICRISLPTSQREYRERTAHLVQSNAFVQVVNFIDPNGRVQFVSPYTVSETNIDYEIQEDDNLEALAKAASLQRPYLSKPFKIYRGSQYYSLMVPCSQNGFFHVAFTANSVFGNNSPFRCRRDIAIQISDEAIAVYSSPDYERQSARAAEYKMETEGIVLNRVIHLSIVPGDDLLDKSAQFWRTISMGGLGSSSVFLVLIVVLQYLNIAERKRVEQELHQHRQRLEEMVEQRTFELTQVNKRLERGIVEKAQTEGEIRHRTAQLEALRQVALEFTTQLDLDALLHSIVSRAVDLLGADHGGLYLFRPDRDVLEWAVDIGGSGIPLGSTLRRGEGLSGKIWESGESMIVNDYRGWEGVPVAYKNVPARSVVGEPIHWGGELLGVLNIASDTVGAFSPSDAELMGLFATHAASAIRNAKLYERAWKSATQLAVVNEVAHKVVSVLDPDRLLQEIVTAIRQGFGYYNVILLSFDKATGELGQQAVAGGLANLAEPDYCQKVGEGLIGWAAETGQSVLVNDVQQDSRYVVGFPQEVPTQSELCVPLRLSAQVIGVLDVQETKLNAFDEMDLAALETLADQMAVAIKNARLYEKTQQELTERARAEEALRESETKYRAILESIEEGYYEVDIRGNLVFFNDSLCKMLGYPKDELLGLNNREFMEKETARKVYQVFNSVYRNGEPAQALDWELVRKDGSKRFIGASVSLIKDSTGEPVGFRGVARDITDRKQAEEALRRRNQELALLSQASQAFGSTLDLDQVLANVLEEVRRLMDVVASSIWLRDPETDELVCRHVIGPHKEILRGWLLAPGVGLAGFAARSGESLIVSDVSTDPRHFKGVDQETGLALRSILTVPLRVKGGVVGVLQVVDAAANRFSEADLTLLEPLAAAAASAIENARLYEQAQKSVETRAMLLREVNHRVKNNLTGIIGLLYAARNRARVEDQATYESAMNDLVGRVRGLAMVHDMLSAAEWSPLRLRDLAERIINAATQTLPPDKWVSVEIPDSPIRVTPDEAHDLALVINELATNAVKYVLSERDTARITFQIALDDETGERAKIRCEFRDDGPGYPEDVLRLERHNIGFDLIQNIVRDSLQGTLLLQNDGGAVAVVRFRPGIKAEDCSA